MRSARPLASQYPVLKVRAAGRSRAARQGDILPYPGRRGGVFPALHGSYTSGGRGGAPGTGGFASRPITKHLGSYEARPDVVTKPRTTGPELMAVYPERGQQNTWEWISTRRNPGTARQRDEGAVYRAIAWPDRTNGPDRQSGCQEERIIVEEPPIVFGNV